MKSAMKLPCTFLAALLVATATAGCGDVPDENAGDKSVRPVTTQPRAPADPTQSMVKGVTDPAKPGAPVDLKFELKSRPVLGEPMRIDIAIVPSRDAELVRATFLAVNGLDIESAPLPAEFADARAESVYRYGLDVTPREDGVFYVSVIVQMNLEDGAQTRTFAIPIVVGDPAEASRTAGAGGDTGSPAAGAGGSAGSPAAASNADRERNKEP